MANHLHIGVPNLAALPVAGGQKTPVCQLFTPEQQLQCSALVPPPAIAPEQLWPEPDALPYVSIPYVSIPYVSGTFGRYRVRLAKNGNDRTAACRLRFNVFNLEMGEGLSSSYSTGLDRDRFDPVCDHLIVEDQEDDQVVGTYRMQSGLTAEAAFGYYSAQEFEFAPFEVIRHQVLELGRASIDRRHRSSEVLTLLWRGIAQYAKHNGLRYLIGCSSLNSKEPLDGWSLYRQLTSQLVSFEYVTVPTPAFSLPCCEGEPAVAVKLPKLLRTYLGVGARICGPPAWDRAFGTIDFLTLLDLEQLAPAARSRFLVD